MDLRHEPIREPDRPLSDFQRFTEERRRYADAKREARRLKQLGDLAQAAGGPGDEHPWLRASRQAKRGDASTKREVAWERRTKRALGGRALGEPGMVGLAVVVCLVLSAYAVARFTGAARVAQTAGEARPAIYVWHALDRPELPLLAHLAASYAPEGIDVVLSRHEHVETAVRLSVLSGDLPHVIIASETEARSLARLGILQPLEDDAGEQSYFLPLADRLPWSTPLVAALTRRDGDPLIEKARQGFVRSLRERLETTMP